jgi:hypothetical protein
VCSVFVRDLDSGSLGKIVEHVVVSLSVSEYSSRDKIRRCRRESYRRYRKMNVSLAEQHDPRVSYASRSEVFVPHGY